MAYQGYDITPAQLLIPKLQRLLDAFRSAGFPVYHTREGIGRHEQLLNVYYRSLTKRM